LICLVGGDGTTVVAFDAPSGKELWRALKTKEPGYSAPAVMEISGQRQLVTWTPEAVTALDPANGQSLWSVPFSAKVGLVVATPRLVQGNVYVSSFYEGSLMIRPGPSPEVVWRSAKVSEKDTTQLHALMCTPFIEGNYIYGVCSYGQLRCLKADTGERVWESLAAATGGQETRWGNAFIVKQGDRFFLFNEKGDLIIAKLSPQGYEEIGRTRLLEATNPDPGRLVVWSHPAFANRSVYARNDQELVCVSLAR